MSRWIDTRKSEPTADGIYMVQMTGDYTTAMEYTVEGGWNTMYKSDGTLSTENAMDEISVARWLEAPTPPEIPKEWRDEWLGRLL